MPIYEYRCAACGHELDALQKLADAPLRKCPECGKQKLERLMSAPSFRLKGSGWYETDFKNDSEKKRNLVESGDAGGEKKSDAVVEATAKSDEAKAATAETKPAASADSASPEKKPPRSNRRRSRGGNAQKGSAKAARSNASA
jgi:putative FmdB family regulatory protein